MTLGVSYCFSTPAKFDCGACGIGCQFLESTEKDVNVQTNFCVLFNIFFLFNVLI